MNETVYDFLRRALGNAAYMRLMDKLAGDIPATAEKAEPSECPDCGCAEGERAEWSDGDGIWFRSGVCLCDCHSDYSGGWDGGAA